MPRPFLENRCRKRAINPTGNQNISFSKMKVRWNLRRLKMMMVMLKIWFEKHVFMFLILECMFRNIRLI